ncbi:peptidoglycan/xylan/chitin deacetylase (PgdA/CDA1 family) [Rhizomicrobium palustre]|uniref:Chitooligosaccharide deacetylase n=1 Tax=Rhizomicrobium palustre TaxID=189966 RepID=A0A846N2J4_9PROT|nr:polysaccharide deacetylase family protein [Rhizomicrobium palustre]NIK89956.1 peptidoglycan/xylan/chitin deacetylase (PgdA/CDA1 family) [Rhizomicrobium palustre]
MRFGVGLGAALALTTSAALAAGNDVAWFQGSTIFHSGLREAHTIALTFDDGPNAATGAVLDVLKAHNVKATFFVVGEMAKRHRDVLARISAEGSLIANHSASHPQLTGSYDADPNKLIYQIKMVHEEIAPFMKTGDKFYFRAPFGYWRSAHARILNADPELKNYVGPIYWDIGGQISMRDGYIMSSADWDCWRHKWTAQTCAKGYLREIRRSDGGVVLMHSVVAKSAELAEVVIAAAKEEGYRFVRLDEVPQYRQYETPQQAPAIAALPMPTKEWTLVRNEDVK